MNGAMVRATMAGIKSQTRRVMKRQPEYPIVIAGDPHTNRYQIEGGEALTLAVLLRECPYGQPGDRLWVRETWRTDATLDGRAPSDFAGWPVKYEADGAVLGHGAHFGNTDGKTRVSIHMPRWASRILLEIVSVRVERLNDCSAADARAEGLISYEHFWRECEYPLPDIAYEPFKDGPTRYSDPVQAYQALWESINGAGSWAANPWVWVVEFKRVTP
jgi:hypothetical protein